ncbi:hypothetical protein BT96DRAFT_1003497 [Gymnopus androsaceus JB14]|uniref:Uncharacterized protein n=1 Tax=Gymnopus androsaceus JB14 TaxID=1447944 RepID=A0A6A4GUM9_9AGAR|nr:hypothetical protein BT96DRAFT_1003497 [Gymnopus androsaceus JB14]
MSSEIQQLIDELISALEQTRTVNYVRMSALAFLVYDICIMFGDEVAGLEDTLVTPQGVLLPCKILWAVIHSSNIGVQYYLQFNNYGELIAALYISIEAGILAVKSLYLLPFGVSFPGCLSSVPTGFTLGAWIPCLSCAAVFFLLTLIKVGQSLAEVDGKIHWKTLSLSSLSPVYQAFIRGGAIYYTLWSDRSDLSYLNGSESKNSLAGLLMALVTTILLTGPLETVGEAWLIAVYSCAGSRLVLDLRQATLRDEKGDSWKETINLEPLRVTRRPSTGAWLRLSTDLPQQTRLMRSD